MLTRLLLRFGLAVVNLDLIARALALAIIRVHDLEMLERSGTEKELRRRYAILATETGLPIAAQGQVAAMAWGYIAAARDETPSPPTNRKEFSFYA